MLTELRDSVPMTLKCMGIDPDTATTEQWLSAVDKIQGAVDSGQIRRFTGNDYIRDLATGDTAIALGWSGDAVQLQKDNPDIQFVMPKEGCMLWSTSMEIPVGAPDPQAAEEFINYVYDPQVQADIAEWVNYVTPVSGVKQILRRRDPALARNQLIFPSRVLHQELHLRACPRRPAGRRGHEGLRARGERLSADAFDRRVADGAAGAPPAGDLRPGRGADRGGLADQPPRSARARCPSFIYRRSPDRSRRETAGRRRQRSKFPDHSPTASASSPSRPASGWFRGLCTSAATATSTTPPSPSPRAASSSPATGRRSRGSRTRARRPATGSSASRSPASAGPGWRSATTDSSPRPFVSSPGWAPRSSCSRP